MDKALSYLLKKEWSMGNGQCPECCGVPESWFGHPCYMKPPSIGHKIDCDLAKSINDLGGNAVFKGDFKSDLEYENFIDDNGLCGTRIKHESNTKSTRQIIHEMETKEIMADFNRRLFFPETRNEYDENGVKSQLRIDAINSLREHRQV